jgi:hypothetical protein
MLLVTALLASNSDEPQAAQVSVAGSPHTNFGTRMPHEGVPPVIILRQLGHANLGITSIYLQGIDSSEIIDTVHSRPAPVISASAGLIGG